MLSLKRLHTLRTVILPTIIKRPLPINSLFFKANFKRSHLGDVDFFETSLKEAILTKTNVENVKFEKAISEGAHLSKVKNLTEEHLRQSLWHCKTCSF